MGKLNNDVNMLVQHILEYTDFDTMQVKMEMNDISETLIKYQNIPFESRTLLIDEKIAFLSDVIFELNREILYKEPIGSIKEGCECDTYKHFIDPIIEPERMIEPLHNYPRLKANYVGEVFNRRSVLLSIRWGNVKGTPVLRVSISRIMERGKEDETLVKFDMPIMPAECGIIKPPKEYVFKALKEAKKQFVEKVGCVVCGKPEIWFTKIKTPQYPLYRVMFKEMDFVNSENMVCRECYKRVNPTVSDFDPHPEAELETSSEEIIAAYNLNRYTGKEWYLLDKGEGLVSSVNETVQIHGHSRLDSPDYMAALDRQESIIQLGG